MAASAAQRDLQRVILTYTIRQGLYQTAAERCREWLSKRSDPQLTFWSHVTVGLTGGIAEAIRGLQTLQARRETELPAMSALLYFHRLSSMVDRESVEALEASMPPAQSAASDSALLLAASFRLQIKDYDEAESLVSRLIAPNGQPQTPLQHQAQVVLAWAELLREPSTKREEESRAAVLGQLANVSESMELDVLMARAHYYDLFAQPQMAIECFNQAVALQSSFLPALVEKARLLMAMGDWDLAQEVVIRVLSLEPDNLEALRLSALHVITREANAKNAYNRVKQLQQAVEKQEGRNCELLYETSRLFSRLVGRQNRDALRVTVSMVERAGRLNPDDSRFASELGHQLLMLGDSVGAMDSFRVASRLDPSCTEALHGMVRCQISDGQLEDAEQQMEFLTVIAESTGPSVQAPFLQALLAWRRSHDAATQTSLLDKALELHSEAYREVARGGSANLLRRFIVLDPDFLLEVASEFLQHSSLIVRTAGPGSAPVDKNVLIPVNKGLRVLEKLVAQVPGLVTAQMDMARAHLAMGEVEPAERLLTEALRLDPTSSDAQLLMARVALAQENYKLAHVNLEQALSNDFTVRSSPVYHLIRAQVLGNQGSLEEAHKTLEEAAKLEQSSSGTLVSLTDKVSIYIEMISVLAKLGRLQEAQAMVAQAQGVARGSPEEVRVLIAHSEILIKRNDLDGALRQLANVAKDSPAYIQAQVFRASVYLTHRHDRRAYAQCYLDLVTSHPSASTYVLLGEAYMRIQAPESAIEAFQTALDMNPRDNELAIKIGRALVSTHDYRKAMDYYESALAQSPNNMALRQDLARLYTKLGKHGMASGILQATLEYSGSLTDLPSSIGVVKNLILLSDVHKQSGAEGSRAQTLETLTRGWNLQRGVLDRARVERPDLVPEQRRVAADICYRMGQFHDDDVEAARECYQDAIHVDETYEPALLAMARLCKHSNKLDECAKHCSTLVRLNAKEAEHASMLLGELAFLKGDYEMATFHYQQLLEKKPNNYTALMQLIGLLRGAGKLDEAPKFLANAEKEDPRSSSHLGFAFCKGLFYRYSNDVFEAIKHFNLARKDGEWAARALENLIELYVNPDGDLLSEEDISSSEDASGANAGQKDPGVTENLKVAEKLLVELGKVTSDTRKHVVLQNYHLLASKTRGNIDRASQSFIEIIESDKDYLPALLGVSISFILKRQPDKARNTLRMIAKIPYDHDMASEFERSYLLLAELYVVKAKYDLAQDLCRKCLNYNKSCGEAWDLMGRIMEKEQAFKDAADCYEKAWLLEHESSASVGFKLAFNYLKAKRYVEAVNICTKVLKQFPEYPRIRDEIMEKAVSALRPAAAS